MTNRRFSAPAIQKATMVAVALSSLAIGHAMERTGSEPGGMICGVFEDFSGQVQLLDESRTKVTEPSGKLAVPCGSWIAVDRGWVKLRHRDGHQLHLGTSSFVQLAQDNHDGKYSGDQLVLYRGRIFAEAASGSRELRVATANSRARFNSGSGIVVFEDREEETQLVSLDGVGDRSASLENRFAPSRRVKLRPGESTTLNLKLLRVVPTAPRLVSVAALKGYLADVQVSARDQEFALRNVHKRQGRKLASLVSESKGKLKPADPSTYIRHKASSQDAELQKHWMKKLSAGDRAGEEILFPSKGRRSPSGTLDVTDVKSRHGKARVPARRNEDAEKRRLIEELTRTRDE